MTHTTPSTLTLTAATRPGQWQLTCGTISYLIMLRPEQDVGLGDLLRRLPAVLVGGRDSARQLAPAELLRAVGARLWEALCPADAPAEARAALAGQLRQDSIPLLLDLPPALRGLPWELLCDPEASGDTGFLTRRRPLVRLVAGAASLPPLAPPLKVLLLIASPPGLEEYRRVDVESERAAVETATRDLRAQGLLHLLVEDVVSPRRVQQALLRFRPHVLHYIGHGGFQQDVGWCLEWEDEQGQPLPHPDTRIADLLRPRGLRAVLLHGCDTAVGDTRTDIQGVAGALLAAGIPAVLAQQSKLTYESSQRASEAFYTALAAGGGLAEATFEVRLALQQAERPDWAVPILQAAPAGLAPLLDPSAAPGQPDPALAPPPLIAGLPAPTQVFVGRQRELRALRTMLESAPGSGPVLALITGPGGVGKSTLAAQAVVRSGQRYRGGLLLSCQGYSKVDLFLNQIGAFLTGQGAPQLAEGTLPDPKLLLDAKIRTAVAALNAAGPFLVVIDNLETVQDEQRRISDPDLLTLLQTLLFELRGGRVLVTGRYTVAELLPDDKFQASVLRLDLDDLSRQEIRQLLQRHPTMAQLGAAVQDELVSAFGGLPYVYDLLSSEAAGQDLASIIADIQGRISQERQQRTAEEWARVRQQVVEFAALETTLAHLDAPARALLDTLSVFRQPFPQDALEQGLGLRRADWQPLLDWALLRYEPSQRQYQLHSLTAAFVRERLPVEARQAAQRQVGGWYQSWVAQSHNLEDYLEAHRLLVDAGAYEQAGQLASELGETLSRFGLYRIWSGLCDTTLRTCTGVLAAEAQHQLGIIAQEQGRVEEARQRYADSLSISERLGDERGRAITLHQLGVLAQEQGRVEEARQHYADSLSIKERLGDERGRASSLGQLGILAQQQGRVEEARQRYTDSLSSFERLGNEHGRAITLKALGMLAQDQGRLEEARQRYTDSLSSFERLGDERGCASTLHALGTLAQEQGRLEEARRRYTDSLSTFERLGDERGRANTLHHLGMLAQQQGRVDEARRRYTDSLSIKERLGDERGRAATLQALGVLAQEQGRLDEARRHQTDSLSTFERLGDERARAHTLQALGVLAQEQGHIEEARQRYTDSLSISERLGDERGRAATLQALGTLAQQQGQVEEARQHYTDSLSIKERLGDERGRAQTLHQLGMLAQQQGHIDEARQRYADSLSSFERLGDEFGRASTLGQLGLLARQTGDLQGALRFTLEALLLFERLGSPSIAVAQRTTAGLRQELGEAVFQAIWTELTGRSIDTAPTLGPQEGLLQMLIAFIQADTWDDSQRLVETQPDLLTPAADALLVQLAAAQPEANARELIEQHRTLLDRCREIGVAASFDELRSAEAGAVFATQLNDLLVQVVAALRGNDTAQREALATQLVAQATDDLPLEGASTFLLILAGWLRGEDVAQRAQHLMPIFRDAYTQMVELISAEEAPADDLQQLLQSVYGLLVQGTPEQRREYATQLATLPAHLPPDQAPLGTFITFLVAILRDEPADSSVLDEPFASSWRDLQIAVAQHGQQPDHSEQDELLQMLISFIQTRAIEQKQHLTEAHPDLLTPAADALLVQLAAAQPEAGARETIEQHRTLLVRCREIGVAAAFNELRAAQPGATFATQLNALLAQVVTALRGNDTAQREALAVQLVAQAANELPVESASTFLLMVAAWLRGEDVTERAQHLTPIFRDAYTRMVELISAEDAPADGFQQLLQNVYGLLVQGTPEQRREYATQLAALPAQLPPEQASLRVFVTFLVAILRDEPTDASVLEEPFASAWRDLQTAVAQHGQQPDRPA